MGGVVYLTQVMLTLAYTQMHIRRALLQNALSANPNLDVTMSTSSSEVMFWKRILHIYIYIYMKTYIHTYIYIYIYIYVCVYVKSSLLKAQSLNLALALQAHFLEWCLTCFAKELFIYTYFHIHIYEYIHLYTAAHT